MQVDSIVRPSATVARIVTIREGDVYKRLVPPTTYRTDSELRYGVVTAVMNNGEQTGLTAIELAAPDYSGAMPKVTPVTFSSAQDVALFPSDPTELATVLGQAREQLDRGVQQARDSWQRATEQAKIAGDLMSRLESGGTTRPEIAGDGSTRREIDPDSDADVSAWT